MLHRPCLAALAAALVLVVVPGLTAAPCAAQAQTEPAVAPAPAPAPAVTPEDPYTVSGVDVDITASSAAEARDKAILEAQRKAFAILFKRLAAEGTTRTPPDVREADLQRMMQSFEIEHERGSAVRYVGTLSFKFRRKAVRSYMSGLGVRVVEPSARPAGGSSAAAGGAASPPAGPGVTPATPVAGDKAAPEKQSVVLPVFQGGGRSLLWEERTPWRSAWEDFAAAAGASKLVVPPGELGDIADIGAAEALAGDAAALTRLSGHYESGDVVVVTLVVGDKPDSDTGGKITIARYGADGQPVGAADTVTVAAAAGETPAAFLTRAVAAAADRLASTAKTTPPPPVAAETRLQAGVPITGMQDWLEIRRRLTSNPMVTGVDTVSLSRSRVEVSIHYRGDQDALRAMLERDALTLASGPGSSGWTLSRKSPAPAAPTAPTPFGAPPQPVNVAPAGTPGAPSAASYPVPALGPSGGAVPAPGPAPGSQPPGQSEYYSPPADAPAEAPSDDSGAIPAR
jgi:hypothetical protein